MISTSPLINEAGFHIINDNDANPLFPFCLTLTYPICPGLLSTTNVQYSLAQGAFPELDHACIAATKKDSRTKSLFIPIPSTWQENLLLSLIVVEEMQKGGFSNLREAFDPSLSMTSIVSELEEALFQSQDKESCLPPLYQNNSLLAITSAEYKPTESQKDKNSTLDAHLVLSPPLPDPTMYHLAEIDISSPSCHVISEKKQRHPKKSTQGKKGRRKIFMK